MELCNVLVVEDNEQHLADARDLLGPVRVACTLAAFEEEFSRCRPDAVLSDLYFPTGYPAARDTVLQDEVVGILEAYIQSNRKENPIGRAVDLVLPAIQATTLDELFVRFRQDPVIGEERFQDHIRDRYEFHLETKRYAALLSAIREGMHQLPAGIFTYRRCLDQSVPCVIVTSAYHHGIEFQPFVSHVGAYFDKLVGRKKPWREAFASIK